MAMIGDLRFIPICSFDQDPFGSRAHRGLVDGETFLAFHKRLLATEDQDVVFRYWIWVRRRFEEDVDAYFGSSKGFLKIEIEDPAFVSKVSKLIGNPLDPAKWKRHNQSKRDSNTLDAGSAVSHG